MQKNCSGTSDPCGRRIREGGFTLVEVVLALMVLAVAVTVLLERRVGIIKETAEARDARKVWVVMAHKMAELELDPTIWQGDGGADSGDFSSIGSEYASLTWEYEIVKIEVPTHDPDELDEEPAEAYQITLKTYTPGREIPYFLVAVFPLLPPEAADPAANPADPNNPGNPANPGQPQPPGSSPRGN